MNWKIRFRNPAFIVSLVGSVLVPIVAYAGITLQDITTWGSLFNLIKQALLNPYLLAVVVYNVYNGFVDYTTPGVADSQLVKNKK